jgi:hypothetical protein
MRILITALLATAALAAAAAPAGAQEDVCVTYDFAGSEFCVVEESLRAAETGKTVVKNNDQCITYDFAGSQFCVIGDTIGYGW